MVEGEPAPLFPGATIALIEPFDPPLTSNEHTIGGAEDESTAFRATIAGLPAEVDELIYYVDHDGGFSIVAQEGDTPPGYASDFAFEVVDTTGAGDLLHGAYMHYRFGEQRSELDALRSAAELASRSCSHLGIRCSTGGRRHTC